MALLCENHDVFAWNYTEMLSLHPQVAVHKLAVHSSVRPVKQSQRRFRPELVPEIEKEVDKLIAANFIREMKYPSWIANIVPIKKKTGQIRVCIDFRNLNKACPKDDFPLPITELMVNATTGHKALSFMDGSSSYNQIRMDPKDEELTAFCTPKGIFCYKVMPFGLKNAAATYQRAMQNIFDDFLHKRVECYVDDLVVKTKQRSDHLLNLGVVFERLRRIQLKMNPLKCAFGVTSGKFLEFIVHHRGIKIDQSKIDAIQKMPEPRNVSELKSFHGHLAYIRRFISNLAGRCQPFSRLLKKGTPFEWDESCRNTFNNIKRAIRGQSLANFLADHPVSAEWELSEEFPDEEIFLVEVLLPWEMYFDGAARRNGAGAGVLFVSPRKDLLPYSFVLAHNCSNNEAEYQAILLGIIENLRRLGLVIKQLTGEFEVKKLELEPFWRQAGELLAQILEASLHYVPRSENGPADTLARIATSLAQFDQQPSQIPICERWVIPSPAEEETEEEDREEETEDSLHIAVSRDETSDWGESIINFLRHGTLPVDLRERVRIRRTAPRFVFINDVLYRNSYEGLLLRCISSEEGMQVLKETHAGICGAHQAGPKLYLQIKRLGYYWPTMLRDTIEMTRACKLCQFHADYIHQAPVPLHPTVASWPFEAWGMDIIGPITPKSDSERQYILAAIDYFSKWAEAAAYREIKATTVVDFIRTQIIYRYGVPWYIVTDNGTPFRNIVKDRFCEKFRIQQRTSSAYNPAANGLVEAFKKTLCKILKKTIGAHKRSWDEKLPEALWAYRMSVRTPTQSTLYSLVYGTEAVLPLEVQLPSLRIAVREGLTTEECAQLRGQHFSEMPRGKYNHVTVPKDSGLCNQMGSGHNNQN
ncbi:hypothetical protein H6P81_009424 [Aristolochia fimbriata]|uniref:Uncharacterized protein n=1 Tax=Aristolochia fimbriata TaxID=158543 RepID=A0AAV7EL41_ARIFI|nr:hypothetical protein H6P81_009424 [Aristolochia fimbriata]